MTINFLRHIILIPSIIFFTSCTTDKNRRGESFNNNTSYDESGNNTIKESKDSLPENEKHKKNSGKIAKAVFYIENSKSMFGYTKGLNNYFKAVSSLAQKNRFISDNVRREFYFVNGGNKLDVNKIGDDPKVLKSKLNKSGFNQGSVRHSNLNKMFQLALSKATRDTISMLISDGIYDVGSDEPSKALYNESEDTKESFINNLDKNDVQTLVIKLNSQFDGNYYPVTGGIEKISQNRPYYIWIFGRSELLNDYFSNSYNMSLEGFQNSARFLKVENISVPYEVTSHAKLGNFRTLTGNKNTLAEVKKNKYSKDFQFTVAVDYSEIPLPESYLLSRKNYKVDNSNYKNIKVSSTDSIDLYGLNIKPTHLLYLKTKSNPFGELNISMVNNMPNWIEKTHIDNEENIAGDNTHTFGFKFLINGMYNAYDYINQNKDITTINIQLKK